MPRPARLLLALLALTLAACGRLDDATGPGRPSLAVTPPAHDPILFVHGWNANYTTWTTMVALFKADGWTDAELATWSYNTAQSNVTTARAIQAKVDSILAVTGASRVDIITHSMGGLSARYYVKSLRGAKKVDAWVSLAGPNHGTNTAFFCFQTSCLEMRPGSSFLSKLNSKDETPGVPRYGTWWSACDQVILPQMSTLLSGATNTQTACLQHSDLHEDVAVYAQVRDWVSPPVLASLAAR
jgi:triacylglycerol lipase